MKKLLTLTFLLFLTSSLSRADIIANSQDWRDVYQVMIYSYYSNKTFHFVNNLGEAKILSMTLSKTKSQKIFESSKKSVVKDLKRFLQLRGFSNLKSETFEDYKTLQFELYRRVREKIEGFVVIHDDFGYDAISVTPYALRKRYWVLFYNKDIRDDIISLLNKNYDKPVMFYGEFLDRPWTEIENYYMIIDEKTFFGNNLKLVKILLNEINTSRSWLVACDGRYLGEGYLLQAMPIVFVEEDVKELIELMRESGVNLLEVIGPENVQFGQRVRDLSNRTIGVIIRTGRTFTGSPPLRGLQFVLKQLPVTKPYADIKIEKVFYDPDSKRLVFIIKNDGNIATSYHLSGIGVFYGDREYFPPFSSRLHLLPSGIKIALPVYMELNETPDKVEVLMIYGYEFPLKDTQQNLYNVTERKILINSSIKLLGAYYNYYDRKLYLQIKNDGEKPAYAFAEIYDFNLMGLNRTIFFGPTKLSPGEVKLLGFDVYLNSTDISLNSVLNITLFFGDSMELTIEKVDYSVPIEIKKPMLTGLLIAIKANALYIMLSMVIAILVITLFLFKRWGVKKV